MSEHTESNSATAPVGYFDAWHPRGVRVRLPVGGGPMAFDYGLAFAHVNAAFEGGWLAAAPGAEEGEEREEVGGVVRREKRNDDGTDTPIVDLYSPNPKMEFAFLSVYLNDDAEIAEFEAVSGMKVMGLPLYEGSGKVQRGQAADKKIVKPPKGFHVWIKHNPRYKEEDAAREKAAGKVYKVAKRVISRWDHAGGSPATPPAQQPPAGADASQSLAAMVEKTKAICREAKADMMKYLEFYKVESWDKLNAAQLTAIQQSAFKRMKDNAATDAHNRAQAHGPAANGRPPSWAGGLVDENVPF